MAANIPGDRISLGRFLPFVFVAAGIAGFLASLLLTVDTIKVLADPTYNPPCNISPIISCGSIMKTAQSSVLGFTNSLIGIAAFAALATIGFALFAGAKFKSWFWRGMQAWAVLAVIFVHWLIFQSLYTIGSLCPYCMVVWSVTIPTFWYLTLYNLSRSRYSKNKVLQFAIRHHADIVIIWLLLIFVLILNRFWYYWITLI